MRNRNRKKDQPETNPKDLKTTITVIQLILRALEWYKDWRDKRKAGKDV